MQDRSLDLFQVPDSGRCWWCGNAADSVEHKYKASDLRRIAGPSQEPRNVYKSSDSFKGELRSLRKGSQVRWSKNLCQRCNNERSQPFDRAYDEFVAYMLAHFESLHRHKGIDWTDLYGEAWKEKASDLSRYLVKQFGCMLATAYLPVPGDAIKFLNGAPHIDSFLILFYRNWRAIQLHKLMIRSDPKNDGMKSFIGLPETMAYHNEEQLSGAEYALQLGYVTLTVQWWAGAESVSMHDVQRIEMPLINADRTSRRQWRRMLRQSSQSTHP